MKKQLKGKILKCYGSLCVLRLWIILICGISGIVLFCLYFFVFENYSQVSMSCSLTSGTYINTCSDWDRADGTQQRE